MALEQEVTVTAKLLCLGKPMPGAIVTLIEEEPLISIVERAKTRSDSNGEFQINFTYNSPYKIVPVMTIVHNSGGNRRIKERMVLFDFWMTEKSTVRKRV
ncbi:hypothetical protein PRIPAC_71433 [Pristionchus pacificus]|uniref:Uncharacterized protein n=1 Tax=Pristionchus pacificus TaxID=54126 RepID=A0A2A6C762_PRIPA|nr:hypothetical protein PRIPAC_71433 [Pristionchus pacificus]|eukprot:PDM74024.1 hypothetical protein PRIPAC_41380 [Pristionchus pacificus]